jgi:hypothetical protein
MNLITVAQLTPVVVVTAMTTTKTGMMGKRRFYHVRLETHHFVRDLGMVELTEKV